MSISNVVQKKKKRQRSTTMDTAKKYQLSQNLSTPTVINLQQPKYLKVPDHIFKQMLSKALVGAENIVQHLDTPEKLAFIRTYAHLLNNVFYLKLEQDFWDHYHKIMTTENIWILPLSKEMIQQNSLYRFSFKTNPQLNKHRQLIYQRLQKAENYLQEYKQQQQHKISSLLGMNNKLPTILSAFVRQNQHKLTLEYERKKQILQFDAKDHSLIKTFYNLTPIENQVNIEHIYF